MLRNLAWTFLICVVLCVGATTGFAQNRLDGKWVTDRPADPPTLTDAQRKQSAQLEVSIEDAKASGTLSIGGLGGTFYTFKDGEVKGNKVRFRENLQSIEPTWTIEMVDDNAVILSRGTLPLSASEARDLISVYEKLGPPASPVQAVSALGGASDSINGIVQDPTKALIPGATVTATNVDTGVYLTTVTDGAGRYAFPSLKAGKYTMASSLTGFTTMTVSNLSIGGTPLRQDFTLEIPARASVNPSVTSCNPDGIMWCNILHRAK